MTRQLKILIAVVLMSTARPASAGGPWAEGKGQGFIEASALFNVASVNLDHTYQVYSEIGLIEKLTLKFILPLKLIGSPDALDPSLIPKGKVFGISNTVIGLKYEFFKKSVVLSAGFDMELRTLNAFDEFGLRTGYERYTFRPIFSVGWGIDVAYAYAEIKPGINTNGFGEDITFVAEVGGKVDERIYLAGYFEIKGVFKNGDFNDTDPESYALTGFFRDQQNYFSAGAKFSANLYKGFGLNAGVFYGKGVNQPDGQGSAAVKVALFYDW